MNTQRILDLLFPSGHDVSESGDRLTGTAETKQGTVAVLGTTNAAAISHEIALGLAGSILHILETYPGRPIVFLVDTKGQTLSRSEEMLCLNGSLAHLASCVDLARRLGHVTLSLVTGEAVSGGFLSFGLMADRAYALSSAQLRVMDLKAMSRVTKIPYERLVELAGTSPTFAPGAENYHRMGAIEALWDSPSASLLEEALTTQQTKGTPVDDRMVTGFHRGGRKLALKTVTEAIAE